LGGFHEGPGGAAGIRITRFGLVRRDLEILREQSWGYPAGIACGDHQGWDTDPLVHGNVSPQLPFVLSLDDL
jgi:hypothetical protein